jgi:hypothetical protein
MRPCPHCPAHHKVPLAPRLRVRPSAAREAALSWAFSLGFFRTRTNRRYCSISMASKEKGKRLFLFRFSSLRTAALSLHFWLDWGEDARRADVGTRWEGFAQCGMSLATTARCDPTDAAIAIAGPGMATPGGWPWPAQALRKAPS